MLSDGIISYQIPQDPSWEEYEQLSDLSYDGTRENGYLVNGLGRLVDGILGGDNFKIDLSYGKGKSAILSLAIKYKSVDRRRLVGKASPLRGTQKDEY